MYLIWFFPFPSLSFSVIPCFCSSVRRNYLTVRNNRNLDKIETLLSVLEEKQMQVTYVAVDINKEYLEHAISALSQKHTKVVCQGAYGTFRDAWQWCRDLAAPKVLICLGSSFLRGTREEALATLRSWAELLRPEDLMIIGADGHLAPEYYDKIWKMYHSDDAGWQQLWDNAFAVINDLVGEKWFHSADWKLDATIVPGAVCQHRWRFRAQRDLTLGDSGITFQKGDELGWLDAHKFSKALVHELCGLAGLEVVRTWQAEGSEMRRFDLPIMDIRRDRVTDSQFDRSIPNHQQLQLGWLSALRVSGSMGGT